MKTVYAIDIGGSSIKRALIKFTSEKDFTLEKLEKIPLSSNSFKELMKSVIYAIHQINDNIKIHRIGICTTGSVNKEGIVLNAGHFVGYSNINWSEIIKSRIKNIEHVSVISDGRASALAEYNSVKDKISCFTHFVVGTGIGGASIVDGKILEGQDGFTGYYGHIRVSEGETLICSCGKMGCLETIASAKAICTIYESKTGKGLSLPEIISNAARGDENAVKVLKNSAKMIGQVMGMVINIVNPGMITIGGGLTVALKEHNYAEVFMQEIVRYAQFNSHRRAFSSVQIAYAKYENDSGLIGAGYLFN